MVGGNGLGWNEGLKRLFLHETEGVAMRYRMLDAYGDMQGLRGNGTHYEGAEAVGAAIRSRLLSFKGEWWENPDEGIPFEALVGRLSEEKKQIADALIRIRIADTPGVVSIENYVARDNGRNREISVSVMTEFGLSAVEVSI